MEEAPPAFRALAALCAEDLTYDKRLAAASAVLATGVPYPHLLDAALDRLRRSGLVRFRFTDTPGILAAYGANLARAGHGAEARIVLDLALRLDPENGQAAMDLGTLAFQAAELESARRLFAEAAARLTDAAAPLAALAATEARAGNHAPARRHAAAALALDPQSVAAHLALARADLALGDAGAAAARVRARIQGPGLSPEDEVALLDVEGDALDAVGQTDAAFAAWEARNERLRARHAAAFTGAGVERRSAQARRVAAAIPELAARWTPAPPDTEGAERVAMHAFLLGFPRSGTTLLEKALAGHPQVVTLEETDPLSPVADPLLAFDALASLASLSGAALERARAAYWARVAPALQGQVPRPVLLDKMPLATISLPAIARLFPDARILFAVRDPRDVVLSCFRRRFAMNAAMFEFLRLADAAAFYDAVMGVGVAARRHLPLDMLEVRHEALVADFEGVLGGVLGFLGLGWDEGVRDFAGRAQARSITPSDLQLRRGLTTEGIGAWRRHAAGLAPVLPVLEPWVRHFGYGEPTH
jgi:tetratricopeptide (TPR) repeat protein